MKTKGAARAPAKDLYRSELFGRRRAYAEASGALWTVLSAEHGLVWPDEVLEPYDRYLEDEPASYRARWGRRVVERLAEDLAPIAGRQLELHASAAYVEPIRRELQRLGARVDWPFEGRRFGQHLSWYDSPTPSSAARPAVPSRSAVPLGAREVAGPQAGGWIAWELTDLFSRGDLDLTSRTDAPTPGWDAMPELVACTGLRGRGADDFDVRRVCTFVMAMDRARDGDLLWQRSLELYDRDRWVFDPSQVAHRSLTELADALRRGALANGTDLT